MTNATAAVFNAQASSYEAERRRLIPPYDAFYGTAVGALELAGRPLRPLAIHHLDDPGKRALFARVHAGLAPGGIFVNAEQVAGPTAFFEAATRTGTSVRRARRARRRRNGRRRTHASSSTAARASSTSSSGCAPRASPTPTASSPITASRCWSRAERAEGETSPPRPRVA